MLHGPSADGIFMQKESKREAEHAAFAAAGRAVKSAFAGLQRSLSPVIGFAPSNT